MPYKMEKNEKLRGIVLPIPLWDQFTQTALLLKIPLRVAIEQAINSWTNSKSDDLITSMKSGVGVLGLIKNNLKKIK